MRLHEEELILETAKLRTLQIVSISFTSLQEVNLADKFSKAEFVNETASCTAAFGVLSQLSSALQDMAKQKKDGSQQKCKLCSLTGDFQPTESASFFDLVTIPGVSVLGLKNRQKRPQTPSDAEQVMKEVIDADWSFSSPHPMDMTAVTKDPQKKSYLDEKRFLDKIRYSLTIYLPLILGCKEQGEFRAVDRPI